MTDICPICNGSGKKIILTKHALSNIPKTTIDWCICMKSKLVSMYSSCKLLSSLGGEYIPLEDVDTRLIFDQDNLSKSPNILVRGNFDMFRLHVKSVVMKYRFTDPVPYIHCCHAIDLLKDYYVKQNDGSSPSLSDTEKFDLLVFALGTKEKNDQLNTVIAQVVYNRMNSGKPTWIYMPTPLLENCPQEKSIELDEYLKKFKEVNLSNSPDRVIGPTESKNKAAKFRR